MPPAAPIRVMIVEDSLVVRTLLTHIVASDPRLQVVAAVSSAEEAIAAMATVRPDVISMDIRLPGMDGLDATRQIMAERPTPIVVISASIDKTSLKSTMDALSAGALSVVEKPVGIGSEDYAAVSREICTQLAIMSQVAVVRHRIRPRTPSIAADRPRVSPKLILCAASTGGPQALARLFGMMPADPGLPVLLVQHMGASFMPGFATWLQSVVPQQVVIAEAGTTPRRGTIYVAPGDRHLRVDSDGRLVISSSPPVSGQRPSATALFESVVESLNGAALAIVLTGMGEDGAPGVRSLLAAGGAALAEHESSAIVNGMPAAAVRSGAMALALHLIPAQIRRIVERESQP
jgi:two-component system chemotaxis response regulator CheB